MQREPVQILLASSTSEHTPAIARWISSGRGSLAFILGVEDCRFRLLADGINWDRVLLAYRSDGAVGYATFKHHRRGPFSPGLRPFVSEFGRLGGTLRYGLQADPQCLDPRQGGLTVSLTVTRSVVDSLLDPDPETGEIAPWLAESWEVNEDASAFTFHLRDDVTFSDGEKLTAELVKKNFDSVAELGPLAGLPLQYLTGYEGTEVVDEHTATVTFAAPNAQFLQAASSMSLGLLSSESLDKTPEELCTGQYAASGPFTIESYEPSTSVAIVRREGYDWAPARAAHTGDAYLDRV